MAVMSGFGLVIVCIIGFPISAYLFFKVWWRYSEFERMMDRWQAFIRKPYLALFGKAMLKFSEAYSHHPLFKWQARLIVTFMFGIFSFLVFAPLVFTIFNW